MQPSLTQSGIVGQAGVRLARAYSQQPFIAIRLQEHQETATAGGALLASATAGSAKIRLEPQDGAFAVVQLSVTGRSWRSIRNVKQPAVVL